MPTREETARRAIQLFESASYPDGLSAESAWLGIYQVLLWYQGAAGPDALPHIIDADKLRPTGGSRKWVQRAERFHTYLSDSLRCQPSETPDRVDLLMRSPEYAALQRQNPLGIAFAALVANVLRRFGDSGLRYSTEVPAQDLFPAIKLQSRSARPRLDIAAFRNGKLAAIVTTKWSIRHDRLADVVDEAISYKGAAMRTGLKLPLFFVTNEFDPARLDKLLASQVVDGVVHIHKQAVTVVCELNDRLYKLEDLPFLARASHTW